MCRCCPVGRFSTVGGGRKSGRWATRSAPQGRPVGVCVRVCAQVATGRGRGETRAPSGDHAHFSKEELTTPTYLRRAPPDWRSVRRSARQQLFCRVALRCVGLLALRYSGTAAANPTSEPCGSFRRVPRDCARTLPWRPCNARRPLRTCRPNGKYRNPIREGTAYAAAEGLFCRRVT